jgi:hypothetical protein
LTNFSEAEPSIPFDGGQVNTLPASPNYFRHTPPRLTLTARFRTTLIENTRVKMYLRVAISGAKLEELGRREKSLRTQQRELQRVRRKMKEELLAGATIEPGALYAELRLLPGRDPSSKDPDDYELIFSHVS